MTVRVLFFGPLVDLTGVSSLDLTLPGGSTVRQMLELLIDRLPGLREQEPSLLTAINLAYARREEVIPPEAEVAVMPPVQGG
jgi:molybdopterin converting factor small subunit